MLLSAAAAPTSSVGKFEVKDEAKKVGDLFFLLKNSHFLEQTIADGRHDYRSIYHPSNEAPSDVNKSLDGCTYPR